MALSILSNKRFRRNVSGIFHLISKDWKFRLSAAVISCACISICLGIPRIFVVSPGEVQPVMRISGLDYIQSWLSKRQAMRHAMEGRHDQAMIAWKACIANRPFHLDNLRQALLAHVTLEHLNRDHVGDVLRYDRMIRVVGKGTVSDRLLSPLVLVWMGGIQEALACIRSMEPPDHREGLAVAASIFLLNDCALPDPWMRALEESRRQGDLDAAVLLHCSEALQTDDWNHLQESVLFSDTDWMVDAKGADLLRILSCQVRFWIDDHRGDEGRMLQQIKTFQSQHDLRTWHWLRYWRRQLESGNDHRVWSDIKRGGTLEWINAHQVMEWGNLYQQTDHAASLLEKIEPFLDLFPSSAELLFYYARLLIEAERWAELRSLVIKVRMQSVHAKWKGLTSYFEAEACRREGGLKMALEHYRRWAQAPIHFPNLEWEAVRSLRGEGVNEFALRRYQALESFFEKQSGFWEEVMEFAEEMRWEHYQLEASRRLFELSPQVAEYANNYAALLLATRQDPAVAIALTLSLIQQYPHHEVAAINHIHALIQNKRLHEAGQALSHIHPDKLSGSMRSAYDLAKFEWLYLKGNMEAACSLASTLHPDTLFVSQQIWLDETLATMKCP